MLVNTPLINGAFVDMHGNVNEWMADLYAGYQNSNIVIDPLNTKIGTTRVLRGADWQLMGIICALPGEWILISSKIFKNRLPTRLYVHGGVQST